MTAGGNKISGKDNIGQLCGEGGNPPYILCGNFVGGGLDATTPVASCQIYLTSKDITELYNSLGRRSLQQQSNCQACVANCNCMNIVVQNVSA